MQSATPKPALPLHRVAAADWAASAEKLALHAGSMKHYLVEGKAPEFGRVMRFPALAATLRAIATLASHNLSHFSLFLQELAGADQPFPVLEVVS